LQPALTTTVAHTSVNSELKGNWFLKCETLAEFTPHLLDRPSVTYQNEAAVETEHTEEENKSCFVLCATLCSAYPAISSFFELLHVSSADLTFSLS